MASLVFKVRRAGDGTLEIVDQTLDNDRQVQFFNIDFVNTVGETGMNCGGIVGPDRRIWTAKEWFRSSQHQINNGAGLHHLDDAGDYSKAPGTAISTNQGGPNTTDYTILSNIEGFDGLTAKNYENFNWMVEVDPRQTVAIGKQYSWGRQGFEGGAFFSDNKTVYLGVDATPAFWLKFVADIEKDFTSVKLYVYPEDTDPKWVEVDNTDPDVMLNLDETSIALGGTMYNRIEWVTYDPTSGLIYFTETGRDNPGSRWIDEASEGATYAAHHMARAADQGVASPGEGDYWDYYGRVMAFSPATDEMSVHIEGGPFFEESPAETDYPDKHLSNPDGLSVMTIDGQSFLVIQEDLNGSSNGRTPAGIDNRVCEMYLLNTSIDEPTVDDLIRISAIPQGAEITGAIQTSDGASLLVNSQHPNTTNPFPYNHSLTFAIHGFDQLTITDLNDPEFDKTEGISVFPNPTTRTVFFSETTDVALYNNDGRRIGVYREVSQIDVSNLIPGIYYLNFADQVIEKLIVD